MARATLAALALLLSAAAGHAAEPDAVQRLMERNPAQAAPRHAHSDFTDPLGRFMDSLAAGAFVDARALQGPACIAWRSSRETTALSGRFQVWDTTIDLDVLCPPG